MLIGSIFCDPTILAIKKKKKECDGLVDLIPVASGFLLGICHSNLKAMFYVSTPFTEKGRDKQFEKYSCDQVQTQQKFP